MRPYSDTAIEAHYETVTAEGGERLIKEFRKGAYRAAICWFAGAPSLIIRPVHRSADAWNVCIPRAEVHRYLRPDGSPEPLAFEKAAEWVVDMGREPTPAEINRVVDLIVGAWPDFFNVMLETQPRARTPLVVAKIVKNEKVVREIEL